MCKLKSGFKIEEPNGKEWKLVIVTWPHLASQETEVAQIRVRVPPLAMVAIEIQGM